VSGDGSPNTFPDGSDLAPFRRRVGARLVDEVPFLLLHVIGVAVFGDVAVVDGTPAVDQPLWVVVAVVAAGVLYQTVMVAWRGQTLGKLAFDIAVVRADGGGRPDVNRSAIRALVPATAFAVPVLGPALAFGLMAWALRDRFRQGVHDRAAGTVVVRVGA
jgi:uncharacterized RDD family membrane protein YckC